MYVRCEFRWNINKISFEFQKQFRTIFFLQTHPVYSRMFKAKWISLWFILKYRIYVVFFSYVVKDVSNNWSCCINKFCWIKWIFSFFSLLCLRFMSNIYSGGSSGLGGYQSISFFLFYVVSAKIMLNNRLVFPFWDWWPQPLPREILYPALTSNFFHFQKLFYNWI